MASEFNIAPLSSPVERRRRQYYMSSPLAPRNTALSSSPLQSISSASTSLRNASNSSSRLPRNVRASSSRVLKPGPLGLGRSSNSGKGLEASTIARLRRQQFRQKCQDAMAKDRSRDRGRRVAQGRDASSDTRSNSGSDEDDATLRSDDLVSSDVDDEAEMEVSSEPIQLGWYPHSHLMTFQYVRRVLAVDYKLMLREMERNGEVEMGWLNADEVAWLEEEIRREGGLIHSDGK